MTEPVLSIEEVMKVARLARLEVSPDRAAQYARELSAVLGYMQTLAQLDLSNVEPMFTPLCETAAPVADEVGPLLPRAALEAMAPAMDGPFIAVPKVIGGGGAA